MSDPKDRKDEPKNDSADESANKKEPTPVVPDPEVPTPEEIKLPGKTTPDKIVDQMSHADGSDQGASTGDAEQPVGLNETGRQATAGTDV